MGAKSREKGKVGEREAAAFLRSLGYVSARRSQQYNGDGKGDVVADELEGLHIEVKYGYPLGRFDLGTQLWRDAIEQCEADAAGEPWVLLWRPKGLRAWRLSTMHQGTLITACGDFDVRAWIECVRVQRLGALEETR